MTTPSPLNSPDGHIPLLLIPGLLCDAALWKAQAEALADIASVQIADITQDDSIRAMARRLLAEAPPRFALAGLSMGGYVSFEIMRQAPERVLRLALVDTMASLDTPERRQQRIGLRALAERGRFLGISPQLLPNLIHASRIGTPAANEVLAMGKRVGREAFLRQQQAIINRTDSRPTLADIHVPTLIVVGADDKLTPVAEAQAMHRGIAGSRLEILPTCGHLPPLELPERMTALLRDWFTGTHD
ncbi:pimeloyl-ACP methyl ester carboxylesterase [Pseudomonas duriflava]|uniref:Pimeloyl-ACP methyl ester carboxylesterase n=1 Tax=Pseudomonas duriflava TaxID=459528 RepID=A0A562QLL6_9PSED|nr:alpha/beta fold hydrolase [Pseudomonas duriflava]TWI57605.1 pimeloyl-ACP methyl ester carboxylesterase [Pseudomonas duriflava]